MDLIHDWETLQRMGNNEFEQQRWQSASQCYMHSIMPLRQYLPEVLYQRPEDATLVIICLSIAVQNLADTYRRQDRISCSLALLNRALRELLELQETLPVQHPATVALLRESCQLRQRLLMHREIECSAKPIDHKAAAEHKRPTGAQLH